MTVDAKSSGNRRQPPGTSDKARPDNGWKAEEGTLARLRRSEARFRATFENAAVGIVHAAPDGSWLAVNSCFCEIVGYPKHELLTKTFRDITHPDDLEADLAQVRRMLAGEISQLRYGKALHP